MINVTRVDSQFLNNPLSLYIFILILPASSDRVPHLFTYLLTWARFFFRKKRQKFCRSIKYRKESVLCTHGTHWVNHTGPRTKVDTPLPQSFFLPHKRKKPYAFAQCPLWSKYYQYLGTFFTPRTFKVLNILEPSLCIIKVECMFVRPFFCSKL